MSIILLTIQGVTIPSPLPGRELEIDSYQIGAAVPNASTANTGGRPQFLPLNIVFRSPEVMAQLMAASYSAKTFTRLRLIEKKDINARPFLTVNLTGVFVTAVRQLDPLSIEPAATSAQFEYTTVEYQMVRFDKAGLIVKTERFGWNRVTNVPL
jgi:hypothetical protein